METETCAVCKRTILRGERPFEYLDEDGRTAAVCPLCKPRAEASGWVPAAFAASAPPPAPPRRSATAALRERLGRRADASAPEPALVPEPPPTALEVFNASPEVRKIAGLRRPLGDPRVCVRPDPDGEGELITVAWDLSWYRWSVRGTAVKQVAKGNEISELPAADRGWNATAAEDGELALD